MQMIKYSLRREYFKRTHLPQLLHLLHRRQLTYQHLRRFLIYAGRFITGTERFATRNDRFLMGIGRFVTNISRFAKLQLPYMYFPTYS